MDGEDSKTVEFTMGESATPAEPAQAGLNLVAVAVIALWGAFLAIPLAIALMAGQNAIQHRPLFSAQQMKVAALGGLAAGLISGGCSQFLLPAFAKTIGQDFGQIIAWAVLGGMLGFALSFFIPNLPRRFALGGGCAGGAIGGIAFVLAKHGLGELPSRAIGAASLGAGIGMMIAWVERLAAEAHLVVHWGPNERSIINLGRKPIAIGSSPSADIYLPQSQGFPALAALVSFIDGKLEFENKMTNSKHALRNGSKLHLGKIDLEVVAR